MEGRDGDLRERFDDANVEAYFITGDGSLLYCVLLCSMFVLCNTTHGVGSHSNEMVLVCAYYQQL